MAPPRRKRLKPNERRFFKIGLPDDVAQRIEAKAKAEGRPQNRIIINELAAFPDQEPVSKIREYASEIERVFLQFSTRIQWHDLTDELIDAVDAVLNAEAGAALQAAVDKLRLARGGMLAHERATKRAGQEPHK